MKPFSFQSCEKPGFIVHPSTPDSAFEDGIIPSLKRAATNDVGVMVVNDDGNIYLQIPLCYVHVIHVMLCVYVLYTITTCCV